MNAYLKDPKTAVIEGLSSALAEINQTREDADAPELNLTDDERKLMIEEITSYLQLRFTMTFKE